MRERVNNYMANAEGETPHAPTPDEWHPPPHVAARVADRDCQVCIMGHAEITRQHHNGNH